MLDYRGLAEYLIKAEKQKQAVFCISKQHADFTLSMGYKVQKELVKLKIESGHKVTAYKMGITSQAKMKQMNINVPIYGYIFDYMNAQDKDQIVMEDFIHPKVEAEIAFILGEDIEGPGLTGEQVLEKTQWVLPALEIIDSRYENFRFQLPDVIADNTSASRVIWGNQLFHPYDFAFDLIGVSMTINGELRASGKSSAVLGNPANSVAMLANMLYEEEKGKIKKGSVILTGGITEAVLLKKGDHVITAYEGMGDVSFHVQ
ncbi:2-keto-4-pentenoate hydratase [Niallia nealsonii]|uniref:4-oxalocrotonate decarboxylase n=1 Tax=Niallia nealsonii TaxID=115979 RepID=A0A2N0Z1F8_9BACI|nr:fumarylacetoacetate hydrolase family protein [Niallia nealsonii]PKG23344.1 4-oxalocrotonate decarboxylase [Niallia nealsonii]